MTVRRTAAGAGIGVGGFGALAHLATVFLVFTFPQRFLGEDAASAFLRSWFDPIATVGGGLAFYATPLLAALVAAALVWKLGVTVESVLVGFAVGSLAFGIAVTLANWAVTGTAFRQSVAGYATQMVQHTLRLFAPALVGALGANWVTDR